MTRKEILVLKKVLATAAVTASVVGVSGAAAAPALAAGDGNGNTIANSGNGSRQIYGNTTTGGYMSPNMSLINGSFNKPCVALPGKVNAQNVLALVNVGVQDIATSTNNQSCADNSTQIDGDDPLSHLLEEVPVVSQNGAANGNG